MKNLALGLIEVLGYTAAIEAADAALKSADVRLDGVNKVKGGLITIILRGDVAPVQAAVDSGVAAVQKMGGTLLSSRVIPRPDHQIDVMLGQKESDDLGPEPVTPKAVQTLQLQEKSKAEAEKVPQQESVAPIAEKKEVQKTVKKVEKKETSSKVPAKKASNRGNSKISIPSVEELSSMTVSDLRKLARGINLEDMDRSAIKFARKDELIAKITEAKTKKEGKEE